MEINQDLALLELGRALQRASYHFTTVTPATHARINARGEKSQSHNLRDVFGWSRPFARNVLPEEIFDLMQRAEVLSSEGELWRSEVRFSTLDTQIFAHSSYPTTQADSVFFGPDTYRYARALQQLFARQTAPVKRAVDIGTGSGAGAILTVRQFPEAAVFGVDINQRALQISRINAQLNGVKIEAQISDLLKNVDGEWDLIIANPPYLVDESERAYRHGGGPLGAGLSLQIVDAAIERLVPNGKLLLYTGVAMLDGRDPFQEEISQRLTNAKVSWNYREMDVDVFGEELECAAYAECDRIAAVVLEMRKV